MNKEVENNEVVVSQEEATKIINGGDNAVSFCSMVADTRKERIDLFNAITKPSNKVQDCIGEVVKVIHVIQHGCMIKDKKTGAEEPKTRTIFIAENGESYATCSNGVASQLKMVFGAIGTPMNSEWVSEPLDIVFTKKELQVGTLTSFDLV